MTNDLTTVLESELQKAFIQRDEAEKRIAAIHTLAPKGIVLRTNNKNGKHAFTDHVYLEDPFTIGDEKAEKEGAPKDATTLKQRIVWLLDQADDGLSNDSFYKALRKTNKESSIDSMLWALRAKKIIKSTGRGGARTWRLAR